MKKHVVAEQYRGLYNKEVDSIIDEINSKYIELQGMDDYIESVDITSLEDLRKFKILTCELNKMLDRLYEKSTEFEFKGLK